MDQISLNLKPAPEEIISFITDNMNLEDYDFLLPLIYDKSSDNAESEIFEHFNGKISVENAALYHRLAVVLLNEKLGDASFDFINRNFGKVAKTEGFLQLEYELVSWILASSALNITSELEVFHAGNAWLNHDWMGRSMYANDVLSKVRLHLLSTAALEQLLQDYNSSSRELVCADAIQTALKPKGSESASNAPLKNDDPNAKMQDN